MKKFFGIFNPSVPARYHRQKINQNRLCDGAEPIFYALINSSPPRLAERKYGMENEGLFIARFSSFYSKPVPHRKS